MLCLASVSLQAELAVSSARTLLHRSVPPSAAALRLAAPKRSRFSTSIARREIKEGSASSKHYYATTPIFYVNAAPHIGHLHSTLLADVFTRFAQLRHPSGPEPILCTGTDEHGLKIQRVAAEQKISCLRLCDGVSERFRDLTKAANVNNKIFIRTTEPRHRIAVEHVWRELQAKGYIYKSKYAGWYAVSDEAYYSDSEVHIVKDAKTDQEITVSKETGSLVEWMEEENYKFRLSAFKDRIVDWLSASPSPLQPPTRAKSLLASILSPTSSDLQDLSISRPTSRLAWGIRVPDDEEHTIYVWIDALVNYLTAAGYPWKGGEAYAREQVWPPDLQVVGKDIIRFHALYLPAVLMALDLPLAKILLAHGHWTMDKFKMSKSRGNVADPFETMKLWGADAVRMYLMRIGGNSANDADYSDLELSKFYKKDLAGTLGNLTNRILAPALLNKLESRELLYTPPHEGVRAEDLALHEALDILPNRFAAALGNHDVRQALDHVFSALYEANRLVQTYSPWLKTTSPSEVHHALFYTTEALRMAAILLTPVMPTKSAELLDTLGVAEEERKWENVKFGKGGKRVLNEEAGVLFPRVKVAEAVEPEVKARPRQAK